MKSKKTKEAALVLPPAERAELAQNLSLSLKEFTEDEPAGMWLVEADRRARELDCGEVAAVPAAEVRRKANALFR